MYNFKNIHYGIMKLFCDKNKDTGKNLQKKLRNFFEKSLAWLDKCSAWLKLYFRKMNSAWLGLSPKFEGLAWLKLEKIRLDPSLSPLCVRALNSNKGRILEGRTCFNNPVSPSPNFRLPTYTGISHVC